MVKKKKCRELQLFAQIHRGIGYRPLPHRIVVFRKEDINPRANVCQIMDSRGVTVKNSIASGRNSLSANFVPAQCKTQPQTRVPQIPFRRLPIRIAAVGSQKRQGDTHP